MPTAKHIRSTVRRSCRRGLARSRASLLATVLALCGGWPLRADVIIDMTYIGNPGNAADDTGLGSVSYGYYIGTYEITVAQYTEFLNAAAQSDPYGLYDAGMVADPLGGPFIIQNGVDGNYTYTVVLGTENQPVRWVSGFDAMRFCNWMANGQGSSSTESGVYDMSLGDRVVRSTNATWVIPTVDEWYKAAYYSASNALYYNYPNGTDTEPTEPTDGTTPREMNFGDLPFWQGSVAYTSTGETTGQSPYGTFDQGGNVQEWTETFPDEDPQGRIVKGGSAFHDASGLSANTFGSDIPPGSDDGAGGFRVVFLIPEPTTCLLFSLGIPFLAGLRRSWG